ncbi:MAG TPA: NnrS family protein [Gammaproteobacteria bacterium]
MIAEQARVPVKVWAYRWFFPAASLYAAVAIPLSVHAITSGMPWPPGLTGLGHAYEMLFGFALALVAGYTLGQMPRGELLLLFALWLTARLMIVVPFDIPMHVFNALFVVTLAWHVVPKFLAAKKWRNRIVSPLLLVLCILPVIYGITDYLTPTMEKQYLLLLQGVLLFSLLMAFMGGRIIAAAAAGEAHRMGAELQARVQPRLEAALIILLTIAVAALLFPEGYLVAGSCAALAGCIAAIRLYRWQLWSWHWPDLICLGIGYGWLALGLVLYGAGIYWQDYLTAALHVITVGALGTLSTGIMARFQHQHPERQAPPLRIVLVTTLLIATSVLLRGAAGLVEEVRVELLWTSAASWSCAYLFLAFHLCGDRWRSWMRR